MVKLIGPLMSFGASGQLGKGMVTAKWKGINYARQYVVPANPRTVKQQANRTRFALLREMYKLAPAALIAPWAAFSAGRPFIPVNKFVGENNRMLNGKSDFADALMSPGAKGGLPPLAVQAEATVAAGGVDITVLVPTQLPQDWSVKAIAAAAFVDQNPVGLFTGPLLAAEAEAPATKVTLTGLPSGVDIACFGWVIYEKPNGQLAYSVSIYDTVETN